MCIKGSPGRLIEEERIGKNKIMNATQKLIFIYEISSAMSYLHSHDIIHRDLKPENILIDEFYFPKVADFGLSKTNEKDDQNRKLKSAACTDKGTPSYISPEIWVKAECTKACDVYAFGIIVYEIMTNAKPFNKVNIFILRSLVIQGKRPEFSNPVPEAYEDLIQRCWSPMPSNRQTFDEILNELRTNREFITDEVEYLKYIQYISEYNVTFGSNNCINPMNDFINSRRYRNIQNKFIGITGLIAIKYYKIAIDLREPRSMNNYHKMLEEGKGVAVNKEEAKKFYKLAIDLNHSGAMTNYGRLLLETSSNERKKDAIKYFKDAIDLGNTEAMLLCGRMLELGDGIEKNKEEAEKYYKMAEGKVKTKY